MFVTPGRRQIVDKENVGAETKTPGKSLNPLTPARKPLSRLNQDLTTSKLHHGISSSGKSLQKIWTPMEDCTPRGSKSSNRKKHGERNKSTRKSQGPSLASSSSSSSSNKLTIQSVTEAAESLLNEVLMKEITTVSQNTHKMYNDAPESSSTTDRDDQLVKAAADLVERTLEAAMLELIDEEEATFTTSPLCKDMIEPGSLTSIIETPSTERLWNIALGFEDSSALLIPQGDTSVFYSPTGDSTEILTTNSTPMGVTDVCQYTPTMANQECVSRVLAGVESHTKVTPVKPMNITSESKPIKYQNANQDAIHMRLADPVLSTMEISVNTTSLRLENTSSESTPVRMNLKNKGTTSDSYTLTVPERVTSKDTTDVNFGTTPVKSAEIGLGTDPTLVVDSCMGTTPVKSNDANFGTTPVKSAEIGLGTDPALVVDSCMGTTPVKSSDANFGTTPVKSVEIGLGTDPSLVVDSCMGTTPVKSNDVNFGTTPVKSAEIGLGTDPTLVVDSCMGTTPVKSNDANFGTTPVKSAEIGLGTDPTLVVDSCMGTTPVKSNDANFGTTPVKSAEIGLGTDPTLVVDSCMGTTPLKSNDANFGTTPLKSAEIGLGTDPIPTIDSCTGTTPIKLAEIGLCTDPAQITDSCIGTTPVKIAEISVGTSPLVTADVQCGMSPVNVTDTQCGTTPFRMTEVGTAITPVTLSVAETLTSPIVVPAFRLGAESPIQLDQASLLSHMESASISNELLRCELQNLKANQADLHSQLDIANRLLEQREEVSKKKQLEQREKVVRKELPQQREEVQHKTKVSSRKETDEGLLIQIGEQMNQIGLLQETLDQKSSELTAAQQDKANLKDQYQKEILNLQQDLRTAYKQHQKEVSDLHTLCEQRNYEPHYKRALATISELQSEVQAYRDLKDTLDKAAEVQAQFGCIEEAYSLVNALFTKTMEKKDQLEIQHSEMVDRMKQTDAENEQLQLQLAAAEERQQQLQTELDDTIRAEKDALEVQGQLMQDLDTTSHAMGEVKEELHATKLELFGFKDDFTSLKMRYDDLQKQSVSHFLTETSMEAALAVQGKQWQDTMIALEESSSKYEKEIGNLTLENTRLSEEVTTLSHQLSHNKNLISELESEKETSKETLQKVMKEMRSLKTEQELNREAKVEAKRLTGQLQTLRKQFKENIEFLEEERGALVESAHEAEEQLKITTLELSRLKVALYKAEETSSKWKSAAENLSEKLQVYQSELDNTKAHAHWMILNQVTEMKEAGEGLASLVTRIQNIYSYLNINSGLQEVKAGQSKESHQMTMPKDTRNKPKTTTEPRPSHKSGSLVASILSAIHSKDNPTDGPTSPDKPDIRPTEDNPRSHTPSPLDRRLTIGGSASSAFSAVQTSTNQDAATVDVCSPPEKGRQSSDDNVLLADQVDQVKEHFGKLLQLLMTRNEMLESSVQHLEDEKTQLNTELLKAKKQHDHEACLIREQLRESEMQERRLRQEVSNGKTSLYELQQALQYSQQRLQEMADNLGRFSDQKSTIEKLQSESVKLNGSLRVAQREKALLQEQLDSILTGSSQSSSEGAECAKMLPQETVPNSKLIKENIGLKKDLEKLRLRLIERREHYEALNTRATRHVRVLEENWHKADAEVYRLDELFDQCKQLIEQVPTSSNEHPHMAALRELFT